MSSRKYKHVQIPGSDDERQIDAPETEDSFISDAPVEEFDKNPSGLALEYEPDNELPEGYETRKEKRFYLDISNREKMKYAAMVIAGLVVILIVWSATGMKGTPECNSTVAAPPEAPLFVCPFDNEIAPARTEDYIEYYELLNKENNDVTKFKEWQHADGVDKNYEERKTHLTAWKLAQFSDLKSGDTIYESATGIGTNLALTAEILAEKNNVRNLKVYGNDIIESSIMKTRGIFSQNDVGGATVGEFCRGDSTNLFYVPSNTFHLAYSGYLDPLDDPLEFGRDIAETKYDQICDVGDDASEYAKDVKRLAQKGQEVWFSLWISELVRITKPGGKIVIEDVGRSFCEDRNDWGGVPRDWWYEAKDIYGWNIEEDSIIIQSSTEAPNDEGRYHVSMKKVAVLE